MRDHSGYITPAGFSGGYETGTGAAECGYQSSTDAADASGYVTSGGYSGYQSGTGCA